MKNVFVVLKQGYEWNEILGIYENEQQAICIAKNLEDNKHTSSGTLDSYSDFVVEQYEVLIGV